MGVSGKRTTFVESLRQAASLMGLGTQFAVTIVACLAIGWWIDSRYSTEPWAMLAGGIIGIVGGFVQFLRTVRSETRKGSDDHSDGH